MNRRTFLGAATAAAVAGPSISKDAMVTMVKPHPKTIASLAAQYGHGPQETPFDPSSHPKFSLFKDLQRQSERRYRMICPDGCHALDGCLKSFAWHARRRRTIAREDQSTSLLDTLQREIWGY